MWPPNEAKTAFFPIACTSFRLGRLASASLTDVWAGPSSAHLGGNAHSRLAKSWAPSIPQMPAPPSTLPGWGQEDADVNPPWAAILL